MVAQRFLRLDAVTKTERLQVITLVSDAINQGGAWITDFYQYSNVLICINFQVAEKDIDRLAKALQETGLSLSQESLEQLTPSGDLTVGEKDLLGALQITFIHDDRDLLRDVPAVPG